MLQLNLAKANKPGLEDLLNSSGTLNNAEVRLGKDEISVVNCLNVPGVNIYVLAKYDRESR